MTTPRAPRSGAEALAEPLRSRWSPSGYDDAHTPTRSETWAAEPA